MNIEHRALLDSLLKAFDELQFDNRNELDRLRKRARMIVGRVCGENSRYVKELDQTWFHPGFAPSTREDDLKAWERGRNTVKNIINTIKEEMELFAAPASDVDDLRGGSELARSVFVVHGHDEELKQSVARLLENLELEPVILHEKPNKGRTIIEKFTDYSNVGFAVVLLSADDRVVQQDGETISYRARQNVILELGFFLGRLGRDRVVAIYRPHEQFEMPSDYDGVLFIEYDRNSAWRYRLGQEMREAGYDIDFNKIR